MPRYIYNAQTLTELPNGKLVNCYNGKMLGRSYYVYDNKLYKMMKDGKFRELCPQHNPDDAFQFYFVKNLNAGKSKVSVKKLADTTFIDP
ncbi:hypothetical protein FACS189472_06370 [Alphaproteobacteria bacterium]|nr:hypothetical protein FACS189472_06370 [Alphaproteobacteria bacterium]